MDKVGYSANPREAVNRALTQLEIAHIAFQEHWSSDRLLDEYGTTKTSCRDAWTCILIAMCHKALGDDTKLIEAACDNAQHAMDYHCRFDDDNNRPPRAYVALANPLTWIRLAYDDLGGSWGGDRAYYHELQKLRPSMLLDFRKAILEHSPGTK
jgi:hypothetical protein